MSARPRLLVLFPKDWDRHHYARPAMRDAYDVHFMGFDLFKFPENLTLLFFHVERYIERCIAYCRRHRIDAVISNHEPMGAMVAAAVTERLGMPGPGLSAIMLAQHKLAAREVLARALPDHVPEFAAFPFDIKDPAAFPLAFPCFVKPVKATFSVLALRAHGFDDVRRLLDLGMGEMFIVRRLTRPFNQLIDRVPEIAQDADRMIAEGLIHGQAVNLDGYVENGTPEVLGICDEHMYPGTDAFSHFEYPSALPRAVQARIAEVGRRAIQAIGFRHGFFNMELAYDPRRDRIQIIEINPRMASQMMSLYADALGIDAYPMEAELALGRRPPRRAPRAHPGVAASFAFRRFDGRQVTRPTQAQLDRIAAEVPDATLMQYIKPMSGLRHEMRWMGSYRYALVNLGAPDQTELYRRFARIARILGWDDVGARNFAPMLFQSSAAQ